uniref:DUF5667 domain-containing protein n=1 Tax=Candidatus Kentrum sp. LPFa TaxID=2126335 RepID=A0A450X3K1_9GAMM|nr:MAG: hypothetical protein BECKLPF1236A_GA0070988_103943 [Candidatus Kentron sp. LPFa]VFK35555.1 MAG: hypothetical protein BECKLPF1236C_GA0070990_103913 [Candidatus Kentron sp. LPFa]
MLRIRAALVIPALMLALVMNPCLAQDAKFNTTDIASKLSAMLGEEAESIQFYESSLRRLEEASRTFGPEEKDAVLGRLKAEETTIDQVEADFDKMITDIQKSQELGDPEGEFVKFMNNVQLKAQEEAHAAKKEGDSQFAEGFTTLAGEFEKIRDQAIEARNKAIPAIDFLKQNKRRLIRAKKLRAFTRIAIIAEEAVSKAEEQSKIVRSTASALRDALKPATPR